MAKGWYRRPEIPGITMVGTNTARSTRVVATTGPVISIIDLAVAALASRPSSSMIRMVFSTTTMASSTTMPMTRISPNMVRPLMDSPRASITAKVPSSDTGIVMAGTRVVRKSWRKM
jgi:hypothetical protein